MPQISENSWLQNFIFIEMFFFMFFVSLMSMFFIKKNLKKISLSVFKFMKI